MYLAQNLKFLRQRLGLSQKEVADRIGKNYTIIGGYERGKVLPPLDIVLKLCELYDVDVSVLINVDIAEAETNHQSWDTYRKPDDNTLLRLVERLEKQLHQLEERLKQEDPELAKKLGII